MKKIIINNKGYMLVEVIVASVIAVVMAYFMMDITVKFVNKNNDYYINSILLTDKAVITKEIMDDIISKKLTSVQETTDNKQVNLKFADNTQKSLIINGRNITYGNYKSTLSDELTIGSVNITTTNNILVVSVPAYTNYSKENYGIKIVVPYGN